MQTHICTHAQVPTGGPGPGARARGRGRGWGGGLSDTALELTAGNVNLQFVGGAWASEHIHILSDTAPRRGYRGPVSATTPTTNKCISE